MSTLAELALEALGTFQRQDSSGDLETFVTALLASLEPAHARVSETDDGPGWQSTLDPDATDAPLWLSQFVGLRPEDSWSDAELREAIKTPAGWRRGTPDAMREAAQRTLTGTQTVSIYERDGGDAYALTVHTLTSETPDSAATLAALLTQKPIGVLLSYSAIPGQTYSDVDSDFASYTAMDAAYDTYEQVAGTPP